MSNFLISCGGTGGHLAPGIAVGEALIKRGHSVTFIISEKAIDSRLVKKYSNFKFEKTPGCGFSLNPAKLAKFILTQIRAAKICRRLIREQNTDLAMAFGGFNSMGLALAAIIAGKPLVMHEANRRAGKAVRLLGKFARRVYLPFGVRISKRQSAKIKHAGYPIREEIKKLDEKSSKEFFGFSPKANVILVCGGSQGASALNDWALRNFQKLAREGFDMLCITGPGKLPPQPAKCADKGGIEREFKALEFCEDMARAMSCASFVVARAGAGSIAEFARCKLIPILVPYPFSADGHQLENARFVEKSAAGICVLQKDIESIAGEIIELATNADLRKKMRANLELIDRVNSMDKLIGDIERLAQGGEA